MAFKIKKCPKAKKFYIAKFVEGPMDGSIQYCPIKNMGTRIPQRKEFSYWEQNPQHSKMHGFSYANPMMFRTPVIYETIAAGRPIDNQIVTYYHYPDPELAEMPDKKFGNPYL